MLFIGGSVIRPLALAEQSCVCGPSSMNGPYLLGPEGPQVGWPCALNNPNNKKMQQQGKKRLYDNSDMICSIADDERCAPMILCICCTEIWESTGKQKTEYCYSERLPADIQSTGRDIVLYTWTVVCEFTWLQYNYTGIFWQMDIGLIHRVLVHRQIMGRVSE